MNQGRVLIDAEPFMALLRSMIERTDELSTEGWHIFEGPYEVAGVHRILLQHRRERLGIDLFSTVDGDQRVRLWLYAGPRVEIEELYELTGPAVHPTTVIESIVATTRRSRQGSQLALSVDDSTAGTIVQVMGDIDVYTAPLLEAMLIDLTDGPRQVVVLDMGGSTFIDSTGLSVLVGALKRFREGGGDMVLRSLTPEDARILEISGVSKLFEIE